MKKRMTSMMIACCVAASQAPNIYAQDTIKDIIQGDMQSIIEDDSQKVEYTDIPQVYITVDEEEQITKDAYVNAKIRLVDYKDSVHNISESQIKIKIRGNTTAFLDKKPYNIKFTEPVSVLDMSEGKKWCLLANAMDKSLMRNKLAYDLANKLNLHYMVSSEYVDVWMNGKYLGNYLMTEPVEAGKGRVEIDYETDNEFLLEIESTRNEKGVIYRTSPKYNIRVEFNDPKEPTNEQLDYFDRFMEEMETAIETNDYQQISRYVDVESILDMYILQELFKNPDCHDSSTRFYIKDNKMYAGPAWDFDMAAGNASAVNVINREGARGYYAFIKGWISKLLQCSEIDTMLRNRYLELQQEIVNLYEDNELGKNQIDQLYEQYKLSYERNFDQAGWKLEKTSDLEREPEATYEGNVASLCKWLKERNEWLLAALQCENGSHLFLRHDTSEEYLKTEATCDTQAVYYVSCGCGKKAEETFSAGDFGHTYEEEVIVEATETSNGVMKHQCTQCQDYYETEIPKLPESLGQEGENPTTPDTDKDDELTEKPVKPDTETEEDQEDQENQGGEESEEDQEDQGGEESEEDQEDQGGEESEENQEDQGGEESEGTEEDKDDSTSEETGGSDAEEDEAVEDQPENVKPAPDKDQQTNTSGGNTHHGSNTSNTGSSSSGGAAQSKPKEEAVNSTVTTDEKTDALVTTEKAEDGTITVNEIRKDGVEVKAVITAEGKTSIIVKSTLEKVEPIKVTIAVEKSSPSQVPVIIHPNGIKEIVKKSVSEDGRIIFEVPEGCTLEVQDRNIRFNDIAEDHWSTDAIAYVTSREIFKGTSDEVFSPSDQMTRAMLMTVLARFDGADTAGGRTWAEKGMQWAKEKGISDGNNANSSITREQLVTMIYRYMQQPKTEKNQVSFTDSTDISSFAAEAINWAASEGIITGYSDGSINPKGKATRAEVSAIIERMVKYSLS